MSSDPRIGTEIAGYRIESVLGRGGMSVVYLAEHAGLKRKAALKVLAPDLSVDERFRDRFVRESQMAAALDHSNIIPIYEAGEVDGVLYIAMRYVRGTDLKSLLREGALPPQRAIAICSQVASALDAAHAEGLVHRDVKPANILLAPETRTDSPDHVYLSDFGITKRASSATGLTGTGQFIGTLDYAAPEQIEGRPLDGRTDVYSLGCVLYECLTGEVPFPRDAEMAVLWAHMSTLPPKVTEKQPELPEAIDDVVARAMAKSPGDRYETCGGLMTAASGALSPAIRGRAVAPAVGGGSATPTTIDQPVSTEPPTAPPRPGAPPEPARPPHRPPLSRRSLVPLAIIVAIALVLILVPLAFRNDGPSHSGGPPSPGVGAPIGLLVRIEPLTGKISSKIALGASPMRVAIGEGGVWVADSTSGTVTRVDPDTGRVAKVIPLAKGLAGIAVGLGSVWVANANDGKVYRLDPDTNRVAQHIPVGAGIDSVVVGTGTVWVSNYRTGSVAQIDPSRGQVVATTRLDSVSDIAIQSGKLWAVTHLTAGFSSLNVDVYRIDPGARDAEFFTALINSSGGGGSSLPRMTISGGTAWVTAALDNTVIPVDLSKPLPLEKQTNKAIPTGRTPIAIVTDNAGFVWVANRGDQTVWKYSSDTGHAVAQISLPGTPTSIAAGGGAIWVTLFPGEATTG